MYQYAINHKPYWYLRRDTDLQGSEKFFKVRPDGLGAGEVQHENHGQLRQTARGDRRGQQGREQQPPAEFPQVTHVLHLSVGCVEPVSFLNWQR